MRRDVRRNAAGFAEIDTPQFGLGRLGQVYRDQHVRRGEQTFSFDVINTDALSQANLLQVRLFGVNGQWDLDDGVPSPISAMNAPAVTTLVDVNMGLTDIPNWQTQTFNLDLGSEGYEYLVIAIEYAGYNYVQGDYFAFDNFSLTGPAPAPPSAIAAAFYSPGLGALANRTTPSGRTNLASSRPEQRAAYDNDFLFAKREDDLGKILLAERNFSDEELETPSFNLESIDSAFVGDDLDRWS